MTAAEPPPVHPGDSVPVPASPSPRAATQGTPPPPPSFRGAFLTDPETRRAFAGASGPYRLEPRAVARPSDEEDVARLVRWAVGEGRALVPRGAGTGMPGHNVGHGISVDLTGLCGIDPVDRERRTVRVGPGAVAGPVAAAAESAGLYFPPLPSSAERCTLGGMVANNAAGARSFLHGSVREWVVSLDVVLADGEHYTLADGAPLPASLRRLRERLGGPGADLGTWPAVRKNSSGYALDRFLPSGAGHQLLVGSEGTLGIITSMTLCLASPPEARAVLLVGLPHADALPVAAEGARALGASACEYFGRRILEMAGLSRDPEFGPLVRGADALLLLEMEGAADVVAAGVGGLRALARDAGTEFLEASSPEARPRLWELRHRASPTIALAAERGLRSLQFIEDCVVPVPALPRWLDGLHRILGRAGTDAVVFGHAGDGNLHVNPLVDLRRADWRDRVQTILEEVADLVASLGGTLAGEHGDGRVRAPYLERIWGPDLGGRFRAVKDALDPGGVLNPGVVVPLAGQDPLAGLTAGPHHG